MDTIAVRTALQKADTARERLHKTAEREAGTGKAVEAARLDYHGTLVDLHNALCLAARRNPAEA